MKLSHDMLWDLLALVGLGLTVWGFGSMYWPLAPLTLGLVFVGISIMGAKKRWK